MTFTEIENYIKNNKLERKYNGSFNHRYINSPKTTFYSVEKMDKFIETKNNLSYAQYYQFLSKEFKSEKFNNFKDYLKNIVDIWQKRETDFNIDKEEALYYLAKKFIIDPVNGKRSELLSKISLMNTINKYFQGFSIIEPTPEEDMKDCWDFKLNNGELTFYLQNKPDSFFKGLTTRTKNSINKIRKASIQNNHPIFLSRYNSKKRECEVCLPENKTYSFQPLSNLKLSTQSNLMIKSKKLLDILSEENKKFKRKY